jgi:hypothetical protein
MSGSQTVTAKPKQDTTGPINENETYTLTAANACGGTTTKTATLHVVGSIDPPPPVTLASMFYPTAYPTRRHPKAGLLAGERKQLAEIAAHFKDYEPYDHKGTLLVVAHADARGSKRYNQSLSERRAKLVKDFLVSNGVPADKIEVRAEGKDQQLALNKVKSLDYPNDVAYVRLLWQRPEPSLKKVMQAEKTSASGKPLSASTSGN